MDLFAYTKVTATHATGIPRAKKKKNNYATPVQPFLNQWNNGGPPLRPCESSVKSLTV